MVTLEAEVEQAEVASIVVNKDTCPENVNNPRNHLEEAEVAVMMVEEVETMMEEDLTRNTIMIMEVE